jgi:TetR/AcrR family fatty acid metabolism transcriptional regulator
MRTAKANASHIEAKETLSTVGGAPLRPFTGKYQRILEAAISVFAEKGFHAARISDVASRASVADGTIYLYFRNKEELLMTAVNIAFDAFMSHARAELAAIASPAGKLRRLAQLHLEALGSDRNLAIVFQMELRHSPRFLAPFSRQHMTEYFDLVLQAIHEGQEQGVFRRNLPGAIVANCFFGALDEMVTSWVLDRSHYQLTEVAEITADVILMGLER